MMNIFKTAFLLVLCAVAAGCNSNSTESGGGKELQQLSRITLPFDEASGVAFSPLLKKLWIISGSDQHVYMTDTNGTVEQKLPFTGEDLEGIAFDETDSTLWLVDEATKEIIHLSLSGTELFRKELSYETTEKNKGPEGITLGPNHLLCVVNERNPSIVLHLNSSFTIDSVDTLTFAGDYSDISYTGEADTFFVISDESKAFFLWSASSGVIDRFDLPDAHNEGIAYDRASGVFYVVNDASSRLYRYTVK